MTAPVCRECGKRPASKDGTRGGVQRYRSICGSCRWDQRMEDIRDERTALYKAAQQSEVKMLAERRLRVKLDESLTERDADIAHLQDGFAKLSADYRATLEHKWQWMERAEDAEARVTEQRVTMDGLERTVEGKDELLSAYSAQAVDRGAEIEALTDKYAAAYEAHTADMIRLDKALKAERQWSRRVTHVLLASIMVLLLALAWSVLT
jgi:hypothetical protein